EFGGGGVLGAQGPRSRPSGLVRVRRGSTCLIAATDLTRQFGSRVVVDRATFTVARGEIVALLGPNGAGKTTTLRMLGGLIAPTSGTVAIGGVRMARAMGGLLRARIGFLPETPGLWERLTVRENLTVYAGLYNLSDADR